ncbi:tetratricopeptide repeat protein [Undibacterium sp. LX40W]|uniref:protein O-GlcNAc transferase n=1 Tax=Undibacterium nitidum TaxID=2762298 RepID=A0A923KT55_9BURK|nr:MULTISPECIES: tetratricopeptide repeat protein [Undibacterium]MBC3880952.1 tetratricopeptide repeat protein [Undibacterium nitidum]MBC3890315.1 tetratricopeptide repeat protein [Undibacterium sp. LX40W]
MIFNWFKKKQDNPAADTQATHPDRVEDLIKQGNVCLDQNQLEAAAARYQEALALVPEHRNALLNLGFALQSLQRLDEAQAVLDKRAKLAPPSADAHYMLAGIALMKQAPQQAALECESALKVNPAFEAAVLMLVDLLARQGKFAEAQSHLTDFCSHISTSPQAYFLLAQLLIQQKQLASALQALKTVQQLQPDFPELRLRMAHIYEQLGQAEQALKLYQEMLTLSDGNQEVALGKIAQFHLDAKHLVEARTYFQRLVQHNPRAIEALNNLGTIERSLGANMSAQRYFEQALQINPSNPSILCNLALCIHDLGRSNEAIEQLKRAVALEPTQSALHFNLANIYSDDRQFHLANQHYITALELSPNYAEAHSNYGFCLRQQGKSNEAIAHYKQAFDLRPDLVVALSNAIFVLSYHHDFTPADYIEHARAYDKAICQNITPFKEWSCAPQGKLRLGFVSGDLRNHPVCYFLENIMKSLDNTQFELVAYSTVPVCDEGTERLKKIFHLWRTISDLNDDQAAQQIHQDGVHILFDLAGYTAHNRLPLFARKPAPVQVTWLGYFASTGMSSMDYLIADPHTLPPDQEQYFSEKIWRLPETRLCFSAPQSDVAVDALPALRNGFIRFASFNQLVKMNDHVVDLWCEVLRAVPNSRLLLKSAPFAEQEVQAETLIHFTSRGIPPERIEFEGPSSRDDYFRAYNQVDICLDPFPYTGGTTTMESLWMGVPVITLSGEHFLARQGQGLLINSGLASWVAKDKSEYIALAKFHSEHLEELAELRAQLRQQVLNSPVCDSPRFAKFFSEALQSMWQTHLQKHKL